MKAASAQHAEFVDKQRQHQKHIAVYIISRARRRHKLATEDYPQLFSLYAFAVIILIARLLSVCTARAIRGATVEQTTMWSGTGSGLGVGSNPSPALRNSIKGNCHIKRMTEFRMNGLFIFMNSSPSYPCGQLAGGWLMASWPYGKRLGDWRTSPRLTV